MYFGEVFRILNKKRVKYVVAGGTAVVLHGYKRFTDDLDLYVQLEDRNIEKLFESLEAIGYMPKLPVTQEQFKDKKQRDIWKKEKAMLVFSFVKKKPPFALIDIFIKEYIKFEAVYKARIKVRVGNITIPTISIDHLIKLKKIASREVDLNDIVQLKEIKKIRKHNK